MLRTASCLFPLLLWGAIAGAESPALFGRVVTEDGDPIAGAKLGTLGAGDSIITETDNDGRYRIDRSSLVKQVLTLNIPEMEVEELHILHGIPSVDQGRNFTIAPRMRVEGSLTILFSFACVHRVGQAKDIMLTFDNQRTTPTAGDGGRFVAHLPAGEVTAWTRIGQLRTSDGFVSNPDDRPFAPFASFMVEKDIPFQRHDLTIPYVFSDIDVKFPKGASFQPGVVSLNHASTDIGEALVEFRADETKVKTGGIFTSLVEGAYIATFTSDDKLWTARQEVDLRYNDFNKLVLTPRPVTRGQRIADFRSMGSPSMADITAHVIPGKTLSLTVTREESEYDQWRRYEGARIYAADRTVIAEDMHSTVIGEHEINNTFRFNISESIPPGPYTFTLLHPRGGSMAWLEVFGVYLESDSR